MSAEQRKQELEVKRAKLEEMRQKKVQKTAPPTPMTPNPGSTPVDLLASTREVVDPTKILENVGIFQTAASSSSSPTFHSGHASTTPQQKRRPPANIPLQICQQSSATISVPPKELVTYSKEVQTIESGDKDPAASPIQHGHLLWDDEFPTSTIEETNRLVFVSDDDTMSLDENTKQSMGASSASGHELKRTRSLKQQSKQPHLPGQTSLNKPELSSEEREQIIKSDLFQDFFARSSRLIERSLWESPGAFDIFTDYSGRDTNGQNEKMNVGEIIKFDREFFDERWTRHRIATCLDTSTYHPELVLASYSQNDESTHESDGVVLIWNTKYKSKPTPEVSRMRHSARAEPRFSTDVREQDLKMIEIANRLVVRSCYRYRSTASPIERTRRKWQAVVACWCVEDRLACTSVCSDIFLFTFSTSLIANRGSRRVYLVDFIRTSS